MPAKHVTITLSEAKALIVRTEAAARQENLLGVIMPNGKPLKDCTGEYLGQLGGDAGTRIPPRSGLNEPGRPF
jgi:hypothetical protein